MQGAALALSADFFQALGEADAGDVLDLQPEPSVDLYDQWSKLFVYHLVHAEVAQTRGTAARMMPS